MGQDLPPSGGYEPIQYKVRLLQSLPDFSSRLPQRNIPARGFRPVYYLIGMGAIMTYGFYKYGVGVREHKYELLMSFALPGIGAAGDPPCGTSRKGRTLTQILIANSHERKCGLVYI